MADGHISTKNYPMSMKFGIQQHIWNSMTVTDQIWFFFQFKMADTTLKTFFGHNSVKFCVGKQFFTEFLQWNRYPCSKNLFFFVFLMHFGPRQAEAFVSSLIHLFRKFEKIDCVDPKVISLQYRLSAYDYTEFSNNNYTNGKLFWIYI